MKKKLLIIIGITSSFNGFSGNSLLKDIGLNVEKPIKQRMETWCEVRGVFSKFTGENGVVNYVCSLVSNTSVCYYVKCGEWNNVGTIQKGIPVSIDITEGDDFIAIPTADGFEIVYLNGYSYSVVDNVLTVSPN